MKVWPQDCVSRAEDKCCGPQAVADARAVAHALRIPHYVVDEADQFEKLVIDYFTERIPRGAHAESVRDVQREGEVRQSLEEGGGDRRGLHRDRALRHRRASRRPRGAAQGARCAQGPELFSLLAAAGATAPRALSARRHGEAGDPRHRAAARAEDGGQGGQPGDLLRARQRLQGLPEEPPRRERIPSRRHLRQAGPPRRRARGHRDVHHRPAQGAARRERRSRVTSSTSIPRTAASSSATWRI